MAKRPLFFTICILICSLQLAAQNNISIYAGRARDTISKNIYGHFAEHLGRCIYDGLYVGYDNKVIPNKDGVRLDVINALKKMKIPVLRWPGGCFADNYHWKDAIGPRNKRKPIENMSWGSVRESNAFGTNEFLNLCEELGADAYLAANMGGGTVQETMEWVQYVNHANGTSYLTDMRQQSGRTKPWNVKYWGVGNESWDCGGHMTADFYVNEYKKYATFMTSYANTEGLFRIAVGPGSEDYAWTETVMSKIPLRMIDGLSVHHYSVINWVDKISATNYTEENYFKTMSEAWRMDSFIIKNSMVMDKYDSAKKVALIVDEWGGWYNVEPGTNPNFLYQQNTMRDAMIAGLSLNIFNNHCDRVRKANLAQIVTVLQSVILTNKEKILLTPTYHVMEMYNVHQDALMLPVSVKSENYVLNGKKLQAVSASASKDKMGRTHVSLVNIDASKPQTITINMDGVAAKTVTGRMLTSSKLQNFNSFSNPNLITPQNFTGAKLDGNNLTVTIPPFSLAVLELK